MIALAVEMKLAIVCDDLIQFGGQERVVMALHDMWPDAPIFTSAVSNRWAALCRQKNIRVETSFIQKLPFLERLNKFYAGFLLYPLAFESFDLSPFDVVLSVSSRFAHGVITKPPIKHICYMNSPGRMFWEPWSYFVEGMSRFLPVVSGLLAYLRVWDFVAATRVDFFIANSKVPQERIKKYYGRDSEIIYPFVETPRREVLAHGKGDYFLLISRLQSWKRTDIVVKAFTDLGVRLKIVGEGPALSTLKSTAGATCEFLGYVSEEKKQELLSGCIALIHPQLEDFGIVPLEAMALGKPVIAYGEGGALETIVPGQTGEFFYHQTTNDVVDAVRKFDSDKYSTYACVNRAREFSRAVFERRIKDYVDNVYFGQSI